MQSVAQFSLFPDENREKSRKIDKTTDALNAKFGTATIVRGSSIQSKIDVGKKYKAQMEQQKRLMKEIVEVNNGGQRKDMGLIFTD